jgi:ABC-type transporter Mla subunit MlaD
MAPNVETDMTNLAALADRYADLKAQIDALTAQIDVLKAEIKATGMAEIIGSTATVKMTLGERTSVDSKAVAKLLPPDVLASVSKTTQYEMIRVAWNRPC